MSSSSEYESISKSPPPASRCASCCLACGICKILCYTVCCKACRSVPRQREELMLLCLGLEGGGKSTLLAELAGETASETQPTLGFSIKSVLTERAVLNVKELGGGAMIRQYWERYFSGHDGVIFVIDSISNDDQLDESVSCLARCLASPALQNRPLLVVCSKQDDTSSNSVEKMEAKVKCVIDGRQWSIVGSGRHDVEAVKNKLEDITNSIINDNI